MTIYNRPRAEVFAENAPPSEIQPFQAWLRGLGIAFDETNGFPEMTGLNGLFNALNQYIKYLEQNGFAEWSADLEYPIGAGVRVGAVWYRAKTQNTNKPPAISQNDWELFLNANDLSVSDPLVLSNNIISVRDATATQKGVVRMATSMEVANRSNVTAFVKPSDIPQPAMVASATTTIQGIARFATSTEVANRSNVSAAVRPVDMPPNASTTTVGVVQFANATEVANKSNVSKAVNPANVATIAQSTDLGVGQTWQNVTSSRSSGTTYTNNTGRPIQVAISVEVGGNASFYIGSLEVGYVNDFTGTISYIIPNGSTYRLSAVSNLRRWAELR